jgi:hypothetical protein
MTRLLLIGALLVGGYVTLGGGLPHVSGGGGGGKLLAGGSVAGTVAGGVIGAARGLGHQARTVAHR